MDQMSFGDAEYAGKRKKTRREVFLDEMEQVVPWKSLLDLIEPLYPVAGNGRHPYPLETMLRVHLMQNWFGLSDPAMEEALYEITPMRDVCAAVADEADSGRDDDPELPPPAGEERAGAGDSAAGERVSVAQGADAQARQHRGRDDHRGAEFDEERRRASAIRRCIRRRRATSGTSG